MTDLQPIIDILKADLEKLKTAIRSMEDLQERWPERYATPIVRPPRGRHEFIYPNLREGFSLFCGRCGLPMDRPIHYQAMDLTTSSLETGTDSRDSPDSGSSGEGHN